MELKETLSSVAGILRPFKKFIVESGLSDGDQVVFYGCPGTCTPFIELLAFAARDLPFVFVFVPLLDEERAKPLKEISHVGMQVGEEGVVPDPKVIVFMGGLAMPNVPVEAGMAAAVAAKYPEAKIAGVCFMDMFAKAGWTNEIDFKIMIDATIEPVKVWR